MLGYTTREMLAKTVRELTHCDDRERDDKLQNALFRGTKTGYRIEKRYLCRNGYPLWVTETCSIVKDTECSVVYRLALIQVNERKQAMERFRLMLEAAANAMMIVDQRGKIVVANSQTESLLGYSRGTLLGKPISTFVTSPRSARCIAPLSTVRHHFDGRPMSSQLKIHGRRQNGSGLIAYLNMTPLHTQKGTWIVASITSVRGRERAGDHPQNMAAPFRGVQSIATGSTP
jgi:PAS domain S-box-containing protein